VNQPVAHCEAEAVHNDCRNQERHEEVEILVEETATFRCYGSGLKKRRIGSGYRCFSRAARRVFATEWYYI
jgi:hypothetical protein